MKTEKAMLKVDGVEKEFVFKPLPWEDFPKLFGLMSKFEGVTKETFGQAISEENVKTIMDLELKMFTRSYPEMSVEDIKEIILPNLFPLMEVMVNVSLVQ